jgi:hypothetical protein
MAGKRDVILLDKDNNLEIYPISHADSNNEVIPDTYFRKNVHEFTLKAENWVDHTDYFTYKINNEDEDAKAKGIENITGEESPVWDIVVDPTDTSICDYKTQIKYRAWITTLTTGREKDSEGNETGYIELESMKQPEHPVTILIKGLDLNKREAE